jgi:molecular chaperone GrpE
VAEDVKEHFEERIDDAEELLEVESHGDESQSPASGQAGQDAPAAEIEESEEPELQAEIERLKTEAAANLDGWQRALAEFNNYRKRNEAERSQLVFLTGVKIIEKLLPVIDDFDLALANLPEEAQDDGWIEGVRITRRKLVGILESEGLSPIPVRPGDAFDPVIHDAMTHEESGEFSEGQIIAEVQTGYRIGDRLLRPSRVRVAR